MAWPADDNPGVGELLIDNVWTDVTSYIRGNGLLRINRGRRDIQGSALMPPTTCDFVLNNGGLAEADRGRFTDDNPLSPYFELLPLYTQFRWYVPGAADNYMYLPGHDSTNYASTTDKAALDIVGDIDIRIDISPASWNMPLADATNDNFVPILASKYAGSNFSWVWSLNTSGNMIFFWSTTGTTSSFVASDVIPEPTDRMGLRVTMDVNNGAGNHVVTFYTAETIDGPWTVLNTFTGAGVTSIFSGTGNLEVGSGGGGIGVFSNGKTFSGKIYAFQLRNSIGGSSVAHAEFRTQTLGDTSFSDGLGNTWTVHNDAIISSDSIRFWGEMEEFPDEWDSTGKDMLCPVHGADLLSRLGTSQQPVHSPLYLDRTQYTSANYWPYEDGSGATRASSATEGVQPATASEITFKAADDLPGADGWAQLQSATSMSRGRTKRSATTGVQSGMVFFRFPAVPVSTVTIIYFTTSGSNAYWWRIESDATGFILRAFENDGTSLLNAPVLHGGIDVTNPIAIRVQLTQNGGNIDWALAWQEVGGQVLGSSGSIAGTVGVITGYTVHGMAANTDMYFGQVFIHNADIVIGDPDFLDASNGYIGETFYDRFRRTCAAIGVKADIDGWKFDTERCGRQPIDTPLNILKDGADVDGGLLTGSRREGNTLTYITRARIQSAVQTATLVHDGSSHLAATPKPVRGTIGVRNDVTVRRPEGGSSRIVVTDGRYGTDTIGIVPTDETYNVYLDEDTASIAGWLAALGTSGEKRFPEISVALNRSQTLAGSAIGKRILATDLGRWLELTDLPAGQAPGPYEQIVQGYSEVHDNKTWNIVFNGTPYGPWKVGIMENGTEVLRFAATNTVLNAGVTSTATSLAFKTPDDIARWITSTEMSSAFPMQVMIGGELISVTALTGTTAAGGFYTQTATCTRSVNGIVKAQTANTSIQLKRIIRFGR